MPLKTQGATMLPSSPTVEGRGRMPAAAGRWTSYWGVVEHEGGSAATHT
jgi:hypothetical protein